MAVPQAGSTYTVGPADTLERIATIAYGDKSKWVKIYAANQTTLRSGDANVIFPGEIIKIPVLSEKKTAKFLTGKDADDLTLVINDLEIPTTQLKCTRAMDTAASGWTASIMWNPGQDKDLDEAVRRYGYQEASVFLGNDLLCDGYLYIVTPSLTDNGRIKALAGFSFIKDAIDSTIKPPYEVNDYELKQRAIDLIEPLGIKIIWDIDDNLKFDKITASATDRIVPHLQQYIRQRGALITSDVEGNFVVTNPNVDGKSVGTIEEGVSGVLEYTASFDGTKLFNAYKAIGQTPGSTTNFEIAKDDNVPNSRMITFNNPDTTEGGLKRAAEWQRSKTLTEAWTIPFIATGYYAPNGDRWTENTIVTLVSETLSLDEGEDFLIQRTEFSSGSSKTTRLILIPPQAYTGEPIPKTFM
ncbi:MAG: LysM peptidoglycan-binding domain-containing protein [Candidatus Peribacteraceae bacterium]|nr:LysM peptidoglycan-binding domain-containing protein [Candidatus Peribacteraceae bacterium]